MGLRITHSQHIFQSNIVAHNEFHRKDCQNLLLSLANNSSKEKEFLKLHISLFSILSILKSYLYSKIMFMWIREYVKWLRLNPSCPNPGWREKIKLNFYFCTSLWCLKMFYEGLKDHKGPWENTKNCENKNLTFISIQLPEMHGIERVKKTSDRKILWTFSL